MNRRHFLQTSLAVTAAGPLSFAEALPAVQEAGAASSQRIAVLQVDTDRASAPIHKHIYGQFLEHINHSVEDGLFAEQVRGAGFEGNDFTTYWTAHPGSGEVVLVDASVNRGTKCVRLRSHSNGEAALQQGRIFVDRGVPYDGFVWLKRESGSARVTLRLTSSQGKPLAAVPLAPAGHEWQQVPFAFTSGLRDEQASLTIAAEGNGTVLVDFVSLMRADSRNNGELRPDLLQSLQALGPTFIRWPGGSYASTYRWQECIGPYPSRGYHPNMYWGGYSDYAGFGTDEFLQLCQRLKADPLIVLACPDTKPESVQYAMDWVHYLNDPPTTPMGKLRAANGHPEPYGVKLFQVDNEPMNNGFTPEAYAEIVNVYGARLRQEVPGATIVACGQKRSVDMDWSEKVIDLAGENFDVLGCHNYEYEPENFASGLERLREYLTGLCSYVQRSRHKHIQVAVLEWSVQHTYDWRAGLHAAGSLMMYEALSPGLTMTCPALLMRNATDDPKWTSSIYHNHVTWFPGGSYPVEKLFREHFAERFLASSTGTFHAVPDRKQFLDKISTSIPAAWEPASLDAIATGSADGRRVVIKAVNYQASGNTLLVRLQGRAMQAGATATLHTIAAGPLDKASFEHPDTFVTNTRPIPYATDLAIELGPYSVAVLEIAAS
ncbi:MAG: hypothetical protein ACRYGF_03320 [Janthinobacterium lividum]